MRMTGIQQTTCVPHKYWSVAELMPRDELEKLQFYRLKEQIAIASIWRGKSESQLYACKRKQICDGVKLPLNTVVYCIHSTT